MSIRIKLATAAAIGALSITPAFAEILNFSWEFAPGDVATWSQPSNPTPIVFADRNFTEVTVSNGTSNEGPFERIFYDSNDESDGGLELVEISAEATGAQIYTGSESAPIFSPGRFIVGRSGDQVVIVTAAAPPVPEPSTWAMMLIGFAGLGYAAFRRKGAAGAISA
jgi:hypothetical protein